MNSWHTQQLKFALGIGGFMSFYGVVGLIVWILSDKLNLPVNQKIVVLALLFLTMPFALLVGYVATKRKEKKEKAKEKEKETGEAKPESSAAEVASDGKTPQKLSTPTGSYDDLSKGAEEVVQFLKSSNLGEGGKETIYSLPWYIVAGTPKSGKSSLVMGSALNFQNLPSQRQSEQKFIRSTRSVDWRVTSDAVFVDTAGRYQTEGADQDEWASLIETIKKIRPNRPLDGFILSVNADKIINSDEREVEEMAKILRTRLDEATQRLKVRFPVYLIFTNADSIEGFRDSFSNSKQEGKNLVWGSTIPLEKSDNGQALFDGEYEILQNSVMKRRLMRLSAPFPPVRQLRIFNFPLHFNSARRKLGTFVTTLFRPNPFSESPFLRGFYFTAAPANNGRGRGDQTMANSPQTVGQTYFTERLFRDVILRDKDLVKTFQEQKQRPPIFGWLLTIFGAFLVFLLLVLCLVSLITNKQMLDEASTKGQSVLTILKADQGRNLFEKTPDETRQELDATEDLRQVMVKLDDYERNGAPILMRFGLYSGDRIYREKLLPTYYNAVEQRFKKPAIKRLEEDLRKFVAGQPVANPPTPEQEEMLDRNYDLLKAYLMLSGEKDYKDKPYKDYANAVDIERILESYWISESKLPEDFQETAKQDLKFWAAQVDRDNFPRITIEKNLVDATRKKLLAFPPEFRYYKRRTTEISKEIDDKLGTMDVAGILSRNNADSPVIEGNYTVQGAYTLEGFRLMKKAINESDAKLSEDDWVMGETGKQTITNTTVAAKIQDRYFRDYVNHWRNFVKGINIKSYGTKIDGQSVQYSQDALQIFADKNSPLSIVIKEISRNTNFSDKQPALGWWDWIQETINSFFEQKESTDTGGTSEVEKEFRPLFDFVKSSDPKQPAPLEKYEGDISRVSSKYSKFSVSEVNTISQELANDNDKRFPELRDADTKISSSLKSFEGTTAGRELADLLKKPVGNLRSLLGGGAREQLAKTWTEKILPEAKEAEKGFPFEDGQTEADLTKLTAYLNPVNGTLSKFYKDNNLEKYFEDSNGQLKLKESSEVKFSDEFVAYLNNAFRLREALFGKNAAPNFEYEFSFQNVKEDSLIEATIDGQKVTSQGTASIKLKFPAPAATETGVLMTFASTASTTSTSGTTSPSSSANSSNSTVNTSSSSSDSSPTSLKHPGNWGLFRFFNDGSPQKQPGGEYVLTYKLGGKTINTVIKPSGGDLFDRQIFTSARAPQNMLKQQN